MIDQQALAIGKQLREGDASSRNAAARRSGARVPHRRDHRLAHLRENMHMLMAVDEIRQPAEGGRERLDLRADLDRDFLRLQLAQHRRAQRRLQRQERAIPQRAIAGGQRPERRRQRHVQADRDPLRAGLEDRRAEWLRRG